MKLLTKSYRFLRKVFQFFRLDVFPWKPDYHYVPDFYGRTAYKHVDIRTLPVFGELATEIIQQGRTSLYFDRLYTIYQAILNVSRLPSNAPQLVFAEVGVYKGGTSKFIAGIARSLAIPFRHYGFDTFEGHVGVDIRDIDGDHTSQLFGDTSLETVSAYLVDDPEITLFKGRFQDTCHKFEHTTFHFVHLDVDLYEPTLQALTFFADRIVQGGILIVDDYGFSTCRGIEKALQEFLVVRSDFLYIHLLSGQMILIKR